MPDPMTIGMIVGTALNKAVEVFAQGVAEDATKAAYIALKTKLLQLANNEPTEVSALDPSPDAAKRRLDAIAKIVGELQFEKDQESLRALAESLTKEIEWKATLHEQKSRNVLISLSRGNRHHRIEVRYWGVPGLNQMWIALDDKSKKLLSTLSGTKTHEFNVDGSKFVVRFDFASLQREISNIQLWANNQRIL
jgi:hypothetical protein